jgi:hypothetical protein
MVEADQPAVIDLLARGFPKRGRAYWERALTVLSDRDVPAACPRYGFVLVADARVVGVILLIFSERFDDDEPRCHVSSWYVEPEFRAYASLLISMALKRKRAVYVNTSSASHTRKTIVAQGFTCYARGVFLAVPALAPLARDIALREVGSDETGLGSISTVLLDHKRYGCVGLVCSRGGVDYPFIFLRRTIPRTMVPCAQLVFCDNLSTFAPFAGTIGRYLLRRGMPILMMDANAPVAGVPGRFLADRQPKFFRGARSPRLGDLTYSEAVLFGP